MPDTKITALTAIGANPIIPSTFPIPMVDLTDTSMAASGTTKKVTVNQILGSGGTATLASATITGDLTVDTNVLKVDTTNNRVGIGTASPTVPLYVTGNNATATAIMQDETNGAKLRLLANSINFDLSNGGGGGGISVSGNNPIIFQTNGSEQMRLNSTGLGVGTSPSYKLDVAGQVMRLVSPASTAEIFLTDSGTTNGYVRIRGESNALKFVTGNGTSATIDSSGNVGIGVTPSAGKGCLQLSSGINFPATQVASSDANTLDDYEEGTWTIGLTFGGGSTGITTSANTGRYTKVGRQVTVIGYLALTNKGSSTGSAVITGLPFTSPNSLEAFAAATLRFTAVSYTGTIQGNQLINSTKIELDNISDAGVVSSLTDSNFANSSSIMISCTYTV